MSDRVPCVVPFCQRTAPRLPGDNGDEEIICGRHLRATNERLRRLHSLNRRRLRRLPVKPESLRAFERLWAREQRLWAKLKRQAIERAGGIG